MSASRVVHCSLCGQEGHNRRSRRCPVNVEALPPTPVEAVIEPTIYDAIVNNVDRISDYISRWENRELGTSQFISLAKPTVTWVCYYMTQALSSGIEFGRLLEHFRNEVITINRIVHRYGRQEFAISIRVTQDTVFPEIVYRAQLANGWRQQAPVPRTPTHLKAVSVVTTPVIGCDCPICFESIADTAAVYTNCSHGFCVTCIKGLATSIKDRNRNQKPTCPMCRQEITELKGSVEVCTEVNNHLTSI